MVHHSLTGKNERVPFSLFVCLFIQMVYLENEFVVGWYIGSRRIVLIFITAPQRRIGGLDSPHGVYALAGWLVDVRVGDGLYNCRAGVAAGQL